MNDLRELIKNAKELQEITDKAIKETLDVLSVEFKDKVEQNEYLIEVKKAKPKSGGKKSSTALYFILGIVGAAVVAMMIYGGSLKKKSDGAVESGSGTTEITADTYSTTEISEETTSEITVIAEAISETETTAAQTEPDVSTAEEMHTLSFDLNGGVGAQKDVAYPSGTVVELPFTGTSRIILQKAIR